MQLLAQVVPVALLVFVVSSMLAVGLSLSVRQILVPLRNARLVILSLLANFALMPLAALLIAEALRLDQPFTAALLLLGGAAGVPFLPQLADVAKGNRGFAVGLMVLLMVLTVGYMPLVMPLLLEEASVDPTRIARSLVLLMLLPLVVGLAVRARFIEVARRAAPVLTKVSTLSLVIMVGLLLVTNYWSIMGLMGKRLVLASVAFLLVGFGLGWLLGGPARDTRSVLAMGTAQRYIAAALVVGGQNFEGPQVVLMVVVVAIVGLIVLMPLGEGLAQAARHITR